MTTTKKTYKRKYKRKYKKKTRLSVKQMIKTNTCFLKVKTRTMNTTGQTNGFNNDGTFLIQSTTTEHADYVIFNTDFLSTYLGVAARMFEQVKIVGVKLKMFPNFTEKQTGSSGTARVIPVIHYARKANITPASTSLPATVGNLLLDDDCVSTMFDRPITMYFDSPTTWTDTDANGISSIAKRNQWYSLRDIVQGNKVITVPAIVGIDLGPNGSTTNQNYMTLATYYFEFRYGNNDV